MNATHIPSEIERLRNSARQQIQAGQLQAAQTSLQALVEHTPQEVAAWLELSNIMAIRGQWKASSEPLLQALQHLPRNAPLIVALVEQLMSHSEIVAVRKCLDFLAQAPNPPADLLKMQAGVRFLLGEYASVKALLEKALATDADDPESHYTLGITLNYLGEMDAACRVLDQCIERWPLYSDAAVWRVNLRKQEPHANMLAYVDAQRDELAQHQPDETTESARAGFEHARAGFDYARFKILDDLGRPEEAWGALVSCNQRMHALYPYNDGGESAVADALIDMPLVDAETGSEPAQPDGPVPIFIVGMTRSGTTLLEHMLSAHSQVGSAGELNDFQRQLRNVANISPEQPNGLLEVIAQSDQIDFRELGMRYLQQTQWRAGDKAFYVDKLPVNYRMVPFIRRALPHAPILHMVRDPMDTCFSNFKVMFGSGSPYSYAMDTVAHYYRQYARIVAHWHQHLPGAMLDVPYAELVGDPEATMHAVLTHCGLEVEPACLHPERNPSPVATPSSVQVREPIHQRGVGAWRRYQAQLRPLQEALGDLAAGA